MEQPTRRLSSRLLLAANILAANLAACALVVAFLKEQPVYGLDKPTLAWFLGPLTLLGLNVLWLWRRTPPDSPRTYVLSQTPTGTVRIAREALEAGLRAAGEALPEITRIRIVVDTTQARRVFVQGYFNCAEGTSNLNASQRLRAALKERFAEMVRLGGNATCEFELEFLGFVGKLARKDAEAKVTLEPEPPLFTGPQYPIDEEESAEK